MLDESDKHRYEAQLKINKDLETENAKLREAVNTALQILKEDHIQNNKGRLGILGNQDIGHTIYTLEKAV